MFGFKIIKEREYKRLKSAYERFMKSDSEWESKIRKAEADVECIREQLNEKIRENISLQKFKSDTIKTMGQIKLNDVSSLTDYHILRTVSYPCDKCDNGGMNCKKLMFADLHDADGKTYHQTICICHKDEVPSFLNPKNIRKSSKA
jgi:hypothetical protein